MFTKKKKSIIFLDSGIGGLSIFEKIKNKIPQNIQIIYFMDNLIFPYGNKNYIHITKRLFKIIKYLNKIYNIHILILACNTASITSKSYLIKKFKFPIIGTFPPIKKSIKITKKKTILLLGTYLSINSFYISNLLKKYSSKNIHIFKKYSEELVHQAESKIKNNKINIKNIKNIFKKEIKIKNLDTIIIGCTHYNFLIKEIKEILNRKIYFINYIYKIKKKLKKYLIKNKIKKTKIKKNIFLYSKKEKYNNFFIKKLKNKYKFYTYKKIKI